MSYHIPINFRKLKSACEVFEFMDTVHETRTKEIESILLAIWHELPSTFRDTNDRYDAFRLDRPFILDALQLRYVYWPEYNLLGAVGYPEILGKETAKLFPCHVYFQNQSDQDYDYGTYDGIPLFQQIAEQIRKSKDAVLDNLTCDDASVDHEAVDYDLKSQVYKTIEKLLDIDSYVYEDTPRNAHVMTTAYLKYAYGITDLQAHYARIYEARKTTRKGHAEKHDME